MKDANGNELESPFSSIPKGFWWAIVTLMTVGYGDAYPISVVGKIIAGFAMLLGVICLALPISVIGATFTSDWMAQKVRAGRYACTYVNAHASL